MTEQTILDMCCGSRMFWFNKQDPRAVFADIHSEQHTCATGAAWLSARTLSPTFARCRSLRPLSPLSCLTSRILNEWAKTLGWLRNTVAWTKISGAMTCAQVLKRLFACCGHTA